MSGKLQRFVACTLTVVLVAFAGNFPLLAGENAVLLGRVTVADGSQPRPGIVVTLVDEQRETTYSSAPTNDRGAFRVDSAPAGTYRVIAEGAEGAYLAAAALDLTPGENRPIALALQANAEEPPEAIPGSPPKPPGPPTWAKWVIVGAIVVGGVAVVSAVTDEDEASPF